MSSKRVRQGARRAPRKREGAPLSLINPNAAGIDLGSEQHYCAVPPDRDATPVRTFGGLTPQLEEMARWLKGCGITTVALESTGVYWVPVVHVLEHHGLEVYLVDARQARNLLCRKTDVQDCQWLQQLHSYGLLAAAFRPSAQLEPLRNYWRHRAMLVEECSRQIHLMQKSLEQMNLQLHKVLSDLTGVTGLAILNAIVAGQRDPRRLAQMCHPNCKRPKEDFVMALTGHYRQDQIFILKQSLEHYAYLQGQIAECDAALLAYWSTLDKKSSHEQLAALPDCKRRDTKRRKNQPHFDVRAELYTLTGVDLTQIDGLDAPTVMTVISEQGCDMSRFKTEKHFCSHLGLCPNNRITGGRIKSRKTRRVQSRAAKALRLAAQSLWRNKGPMGDYFRRMRSIHGAPKAITAVAHKLARILYRALTHGSAYVVNAQRHQDEQQKKRARNYLIKRAKEIGCILVEDDTGEVLS